MIGITFERREDYISVSSLPNLPPEFSSSHSAQKAHLERTPPAYESQSSRHEGILRTGQRGNIGGLKCRGIHYLLETLLYASEMPDTGRNKVEENQKGQAQQHAVCWSNPKGFVPLIRCGSSRREMQPSMDMQSTAERCAVLAMDVLRAENSEVAMLERLICKLHHAWQDSRDKTYCSRAASSGFARPERDTAV
ncbi:hypothetical protein ANO11243_043550 [Dothideomycetidae sp. 11243]|nr:hypothetical protein ANO11243_043550 [fungal sp. No.11243]